MKKTTALLLAGGKSRRMGQNKALLTYKNKSFLERVLDSVASFDEVLIMANDKEAYAHLGVKVVEDVFPGCGPMSGLHAGLKAARNETCLLLPCDMPHIDEAVTEYMTSHIEDGFDAIIPKTKDGKKHPLLGIYHKKMLSKVEQSLQNNHYKMKRLLDEVKVKYVALDETYFDTEKVLANVNTPEELSKLKRDQPPVIAISGVSNSGKTTVLTKAIKGLKEKGYTIGTIKHDGHGFDMDHEGKDTYKHREAGADGIIIASRHQYAMIQQTPEKEIELDRLIELQKHHDIVLLEGFKFCSYPKFEVVRRERSIDTVCDEKTLLGVVTDVAMKKGHIPILGLHDTEKLVEAIEVYVKEYNSER